MVLDFGANVGPEDKTGRSPYTPGSRFSPTYYTNLNYQYDAKGDVSELGAYQRTGRRGLAHKDPDKDFNAVDSPTKGPTDIGPVDEAYNSGEIGKDGLDPNDTNQPGFGDFENSPNLDFTADNLSKIGQTAFSTISGALGPVGHAFGGPVGGLARTQDPSIPGPPTLRDLTDFFGFTDPEVDQKTIDAREAFDEPTGRANDDIGQIGDDIAASTSGAGKTTSDNLGPSGPSSTSLGDEGHGQGDDTGECFVSTALADTGLWSASEKRRAVMWCRETHHDGSGRGRMWVDGYHQWGRLVGKIARKHPLFRKFVRWGSNAFMRHVNGEKTIAGAFWYYGWAQPLSYSIGFVHRLTTGRGRAGQCRKE